jgi:hypothetical protein
MQIIARLPEGAKSSLRETRVRRVTETRALIQLKLRKDKIVNLKNFARPLNWGSVATLRRNHL